LAELAVQSADGKQAVEVGWTVDPGLNGGSLDPHLFVYHWKNGAKTCYNGCGFVKYGTPPFGAGDNVAAHIGLSKKFTIEFANGVWWIGYDTAWIGYYSASIWSSLVPPVTFNTVGLYQGFGEIAGEAKPCTDMGRGIPGAVATNGARVGSVKHKVAGVWTGANMSVGVSPAMPSTVSNIVLVTASAETARYGGPMYDGAGVAAGITGGC
jgi:hypothetical protein